MQSKSEFVLRRVTDDGLASDEIIGRDYSKLYDDRSLDPKGVPVNGTEGVVGEQYFKAIKKNGWDIEQIHIVLVADFGTKLVPCYKKSDYFIMLNGSTHERIKSF